ncbi:SAM-dependent methyltransferase [Candidatus Latescibacterota bacterium]
MKKQLNLIVALFFLFSPAAFGQYDVPYVPTDYAVVDSMLSMVQVREGEKLYDLGCGDGRIVVTAAKKFGARAVGIDINPVRIEESWANAEKESVTDRVEFLEQNLFETDFRDADVITMYLLQWVNLRLRPMFFRDLKPGTRLVSHAFTMGEWEADRRMEIARSDGWGTSNLYFWVLPANVSGDWSFDTGDLPHLLHIDQAFQRITGTMEVRENQRPIDDMELSGDRIHFVVNVAREDNTVSYEYNGVADGDTITGTITSGGNVTKWVATRDPSTAVPLDITPEEAESQPRYGY